LVPSFPWCTEGAREWLHAPPARSIDTAPSSSVMKSRRLKSNMRLPPRDPLAPASLGQLPG
jgi:hypothetical protein